MATEYETLLSTMHDGFHGVHNRIDAFNAEFNNHRLSCAKLFEEIHLDEANRKGIATATANALKIHEENKAVELRNRINVGTVKTYIVGLLLGVITLGALKILFTNLGQWKW